MLNEKKTNGGKWKILPFFFFNSNEIKFTVEPKANKKLTSLIQQN